MFAVKKSRRKNKQFEVPRGIYILYTYRRFVLALFSGGKL